jgi:putative PIG3 family NAD(P)H quinone oxidoreductase
MQAIVISEPGPPKVLKIREIADPEPDSGELLVAVHAAALNRADLLQRRGNYPPPPGVRGDIPGLEFAGEVIAAGSKVTNFKPGERVTGLLPGAGYAEKIVTPEGMAMPIPPHLSFEEAAAIPEGFITAFDALFLQLDLRLGERLLIHAVGSGVGIAALQLAKAAGATVFGTAGSGEKIAKAKTLGLDFGINYKTQDFGEVISQISSEGVHAILDMVGANYWEKNLECLATKGRIILVGLLGGAKVETNLSSIMRKRIQVIGTVLRGRSLEEKISLTQAFQKHALPLFETGKLKPVIDRIFPLAEAATAHQYMEENRNFGKIVLRVG